MRYLRRVGVAVAAVLTAGAGTALAAPDNKHTETFPVTCDGVMVQVTINARSQGAAAWVDGRVAVAKAFAGSGSFTITVGGVTYGPFPEQFEEELHGQGLQDKVVACTFTDQFTETFPLDAETAEMFGIAPSLIGQMATVTGTFNGTAWVMFPGRR